MGSNIPYPSLHHHIHPTPPAVQSTKGQNHSATEYYCTMLTSRVQIRWSCYIQALCMYRALVLPHHHAASHSFVHFHIPSFIRPFLHSTLHPLIRANIPSSILAFTIQSHNALFTYTCLHSISLPAFTPTYLHPLQYPFKPVRHRPVAFKRFLFAICTRALCNHQAQTPTFTFIHSPLHRLINSQILTLLLHPVTILYPVASRLDT